MTNLYFSFSPKDKLHQLKGSFKAPPNYRQDDANELKKELNESLVKTRVLVASG